MAKAFNLNKFKRKSKLTERYEQQLARLAKQEIETGCIEQAVNGAIKNITTSKKASLVIYGDPQSGKTEMMICLTARLLDSGYPVIIHLMNDSVDLLSQNLRRFKISGLAPAARSTSEIIQSKHSLAGQELVVFCKKNGSNLKNLIERLKGLKRIVVIDDEADYATPNSKINKGSKTPINKLVEKLLGKDGIYIGVTATPARLNLNKTFNNNAEHWVQFPPHSQYTGQDTFFPINKQVMYRLSILNNNFNVNEAVEALLRFIITAAHLNTSVNKFEENYTFLVHTSGRKIDHEEDREIIEKSVNTLTNSKSKLFPKLIAKIHSLAAKLYPQQDPDVITGYVVQNASRATSIVLNSERDRRAAGDHATEPSSLFTIIIGGNIVSRGVTFPNLLGMFFTRDVSSKLQQDTYIQRARMFGARGAYLQHFELTIPANLYADWHRCFVFHRLALATIKSNMGSPVWIGDGRISVASSASIDKATVSLSKGEMSFQMFRFVKKLDDVVLEGQSKIDTLLKIREIIGQEALPKFLIDYIKSVMPDKNHSLAIHTSGSISGYSSETTNREMITRKRGFIGNPQLEISKFPKAIHHIKILYNHTNMARLFYKNTAGVQFIQRLQN